MQTVPQVFYFPGFLRPHSRQRGRHGQECVCGHKPSFCQSVQLFKPRIVPLIDFFKRSHFYRESPVPDIFQELPKGSKMQLCTVKVLYLFTDCFYIFNRRTASMITHAVAADHFVIFFCTFQCIIDIFQGRFPEPGGVLRRKAYGIHAASVRTFPPEDRGIQSWAHKHIGIHAALF